MSPLEMTLRNSLSGLMNFYGTVYNFVQNPHNPNMGEYEQVTGGPGGKWKIIDLGKGLELVTDPKIHEERLFVKVAFVPESVIGKVTSLIQGEE